MGRPRPAGAVGATHGPAVYGLIAVRSLDWRGEVLQVDSLLSLSHPLVRRVCHVPCLADCCRRDLSGSAAGRQRVGRADETEHHGVGNDVSVYVLVAIW